jgi:hypothetical protein
LGLLFAFTACIAAEPAVDAKLAFTEGEKVFRFDTGVLRGVLRAGDKSLGLQQVVYVPTGTPVDKDKGYGLFSHYRILTSATRYGTAAWDWPSAAKLLDDGAVEVTWEKAADRPFAMKAVYRWKAADTLDVTTTVSAAEALPKFEVFLASYFQAFNSSRVYVTGDPERPGQAVFMEAQKPAGVWQMFAYDADAEKLINDGRWQRPPHPVQWTIMPRYSVPLAMRRDAKSGVTVLLMAPIEGCFAVATPYGDEPHWSTYLSLFGRDIKAGETATARARLVIGKDITDEQALERYGEYVKK